MNSSLELAIDRAGGIRPLARLLAPATSAQAIHGWRKRNLIPARWVLPIERATQVPRHELRPDLYPLEDREAEVV